MLEIHRLRLVLAMAMAIAIPQAALATTDLSSVPACIGSEPKLSRSLVKTICEAALLVEAKNYPAAKEKIDVVSRISGRTPYDDFNLNVLILNVAIATNDVASARVAADFLSDSPELTDAKANVLRSGLIFNFLEKRYDRAIELGNRLRAAGLMRGSEGMILAQAYYMKGDYGNSRAIADQVIKSDLFNDASMTDKSREKTKIVLDNSISMQKQASNGGAGGAILGVLGEAIQQSGNGGRGSAGGSSSGGAVAQAPNLSDEFYANQMQAITKYTAWQKADATFADIEFQDGQFVVLWQEIPTAYQKLQNSRVQQADQHFTWNNWMAMSQDTAMSNLWSIACLFDPSEGTKLSAIKIGSVKSVQLKLKTAKSHQLTFECRV